MAVPDLTYVEVRNDVCRIALLPVKGDGGVNKGTSGGLLGTEAERTLVDPTTKIIQGAEWCQHNESYSINILVSL